ncbi:MAG: restriction endonuclease [Dehalococcoidia bacterium]|nr:restriction endonuclease [Dehalococcoidia bacterium]
MLPLMESIADGDEHSLRDTIDHLSCRFDLSGEERRALLPSGMQPVFDNRVGWARTYLKNAGLIEYTRRGSFRITQRGRATLNEGLTKIDLHYLDQFPEFQEFRTTKRKPEAKTASPTTTPDEGIETAYLNLTNTLAVDLLAQVKRVTPGFFERLVVDLLLALGYGGSRKDAGEAIGKSGDEGLDGIIREDRLGLDAVYVQAKLWEGSVGRPEVQRFAGALMGKGARKGIMITASSFSAEARDYAKHVEGCRIVLIEGTELARLMIEHNVGVTPVRTYEVKRIDTDYFEG